MPPKKETKEKEKTREELEQALEELKKQKLGLQEPAVESTDEDMEIPEPEVSDEEAKELDRATEIESLNNEGYFRFHLLNQLYLLNITFGEMRDYLKKILTSP